MRDYGVEGQLGLESHPQEWINKLVDGFRILKQKLKKTGSIYINLGDTYFGSPTRAGEPDPKFPARLRAREQFNGQKSSWLQPKQLMLMPSRFAIAMQDDGWILRNDIIWHKPNTIPSSVKDRLNTTYEHVFHFVKSKKYFYDLDAIREPHLQHSLERIKRAINLKEKTDRSYTDLNKYARDDAPYGVMVERGAHIAGKNPGDVISDNYETLDDMEYKVLTGCPIHSLLLHPEILKILSCGEQQDYLLSHNLDRYGYLSPMLSSSLLSKLNHNILGFLLSKTDYHFHANADEQILENGRDSKMLIPCSHASCQESYLQKISHTKNIQREHENQDDSSDYSYQHYGWTAIPHNMKVHKKVFLSLEHDNVFLKIPYGIVSILQSHGCICSYYTEAHFPLNSFPPDFWNITIEPFKESHFATFPTKLVEKPIKSSCPSEICVKCGFIRERITKPIDEYANRLKEKKNEWIATWDNKGIEGHRAKPDAFNYAYQTIGFTSCDCNVGWKSGIVLDPFAGSGTTCLVARKLSRQFIGFELNPKYIEIANNRLKPYMEQKKLSEILNGSI